MSASACASYSSSFLTQAFRPSHLMSQPHRQQVLHLYRHILKSARLLPSYNHRGHVLQSARSSFRANASLPETEAAFARDLGETQLENLRSQVTHMRGIMAQNTLSHTAPKPDRMYQPMTSSSSSSSSSSISSSSTSTSKRSYHTSATRFFATPTAPAPTSSSVATAKPTSAAAFWGAGVDPAAVANAAVATSAPGLPPSALDSPFTPPVALVATHIVHVLLTHNNTICTLTTMSGDTKAWTSSGTCGFKNAKKSTYMACIACGEQLGAKARNAGVKSVDMHVSGFHKNKKAVLKGLMKSGLNIIAIRDTTPIPFNGCKPKKMRRL